MLCSGTPTADELLDSAKTLRYTNNGEMFSTKWLLDLFKETLTSTTLNPKNLREYLYDGVLDSEFIREKLKQHSMLLVPYDADRNHSPCNNRGHKAHWCLITGYLIDDSNEVS
jgi:hypothetical protein